MPTSVKQKLAAANAAVPRISQADAAELMERGEALVVDVRDAPELASGGKVKGRGARLARHAGISRRPGVALS